MLRILRLIAPVMLAAGSPQFGLSSACAQTLPDVPPLPRQERLVERTDLTATLRAARVEIVAGERPELTMVLTNRGTRRMRLPSYGDFEVNSTTRLRAFDAGGEEMHPASTATLEGRVLPSSVRSFPELLPGRSREFQLKSDWNMPDPLPTGAYVFRATYSSWAGRPAKYDVRESGADEMWEGELDADISIHVRPLDPASEQQLIETVRVGDEAAARDAIRILGLSRSAAAVDAIVERVERDYGLLPAALTSIAYIGTPHAARALAAGHERVPAETRARHRGLLAGERLPVQALRSFIRSAGCEVLGLGTLLPDFRYVTADLRQACPEVTQLLRAESLREPDAKNSALRRWAEALLKSFASVASPPEFVSPSELLSAPPTAVRLAEYVTAIIEFPGGHTEVLETEFGGVTRFGTHETFRRLRAALESATDERAYAIKEALRALTFEEEVWPEEDRAGELRRWDQWWQQRGQESRERWARRAIARQPAISESVYHVTGASRAAEYLLILNRPRHERKLVTHPSWQVRVVAAVNIAETRPRHAAALLLRELRGRYLSACFNAANQLAHLTGTWYPFECSRSHERRAAIEHWTRAASTLP